MIETGIEPIAWNADPTEFQRDQARASKPSEVTRLSHGTSFQCRPECKLELIGWKGARCDRAFHRWVTQPKARAFFIQRLPAPAICRL